jgi:hypothetical protein
MHARAHLKLIVCEPDPGPIADDVTERVSMIRPLAAVRLRRHWLEQNRNVVALWSASFVLLALAVVVLLLRR